VLHKGRPPALQGVGHPDRSKHRHIFARTGRGPGWPASPDRILLDTSSVVHQLHGHTLQQAAIREAVTGAEVLVPVFVRMEYLRGVNLNLIEIP
jgi:hypothetical protein